MNSNTGSQPEQVHKNPVGNALDFLLSASEAVQRDKGTQEPQDNISGRHLDGISPEMRVATQA